MTQEQAQAIAQALAATTPPASTQEQPTAATAPQPAPAVSTATKPQNPAESHPTALPAPAPAPRKNNSRNQKGTNRYTNGIDGASYAMRKAKAKALLDAGATYDEVAQETGLCRAVIADVSMGRAEVNENVVEAMRKTESGLLTRTIGTIARSFDGELIDKANLTQRSIALGILVEKRELLDGRPTSRSAFASLPDQQLNDEIQRLQRELDGWHSGEVINTDAVESDSSSIRGTKSTADAPPDGRQDVAPGQ